MANDLRSEPRNRWRKVLASAWLGLSSPRDATGLALQLEITGPHAEIIEEERLTLLQTAYRYQPELLVADLPLLAERAAAAPSASRTGYLRLLGGAAIGAASEEARLLIRILVQGARSDNEAHRGAAVEVLGEVITRMPEHVEEVAIELLNLPDGSLDPIQLARVLSKVRISQGVRRLLLVRVEGRALAGGVAPEMRAAAVEMLGRLGHSGGGARVAQVLSDLSADSSPTVRGAAATALTDLALGVSETRQVAAVVLSTLLEDRSYWVREEAALGLLLLAGGTDHDLSRSAALVVGSMVERGGQIGGRKLAERFTATSPEAVVRVSRAVVETATQLDEADIWLARSLVEALAEQQPAAIPEIVASCCRWEGPGTDLAWQLTWSLRDRVVSGDPGAIEPLVALLDSETPELQGCGARLLGVFAGHSRRVAPLTLERLEAAFHSPATQHAALGEIACSIGLATQALGPAGEPGLKVLVSCLDRGEPEVRQACARALSQAVYSGAPLSRPQLGRLTAALDDPQATVREWAALTLAAQARTMPGVRLPALQRLRITVEQESDTAAGAVATRALAALGGDDPAVSGMVLSRARELLTSPEAGVRLRGAAIAEELARSHPQHSGAAVSVLAAVAPAERHPSASICGIARIGMASDIGARAAVTALGALLDEADSVFDVLNNGLKPVLREQPQVAHQVLPVLTVYLRSPRDGDLARSNIQAAGRLWTTAALQIVRNRGPRMLVDHLTSRYRLIREAATRAVILLISESPEQLPLLRDLLEQRGDSLLPYRRAAASLLLEGMTLLQTSINAADDRQQAVRWQRLLQAVPKEAGLGDWVAAAEQLLASRI